jgi:hypothetical protein
MNEIGRKLSELRGAWDDQARAQRLSLELLDHGSIGIEGLVGVLREASGDQPKLSVAILNSFKERPTHLALQRLATLLDEGVLSEEDAAYATEVLARNRQDTGERLRLVRSLKRTRDPVARVDVLSQVVRLHVLEAKEALGEIAAKIPYQALDYTRDPEGAAREEMVLFAVDALEDRHAKLESIAFGSENPVPRRNAALGMLCLTLGERSRVFLQRALGDPNRSIRGAALELVGEVRLRDSFDLLKAGFADPDSWVILQAFHAVRELLSSPALTEDLSAIRGLKETIAAAVTRLEHTDDSTVQRTVLPALRKQVLVIEGLLRAPVKQS